MISSPFTQKEQELIKEDLSSLKVELPSLLDSFKDYWDRLTSTVPLDDDQFSTIISGYFLKDISDHEVGFEAGWEILWADTGEESFLSTLTEQWDGWQILAASCGIEIKDWNFNFSTPFSQILKEAERQRLQIDDETKQKNKDLEDLIKNRNPEFKIKANTSVREWVNFTLPPELSKIILHPKKTLKDLYLHFISNKELEKDLILQTLIKSYQNLLNSSIKYLLSKNKISSLILKFNIHGPILVDELDTKQFNPAGIYSQPLGLPNQPSSDIFSSLFNYEEFNEINQTRFSQWNVNALYGQFGNRLCEEHDITNDFDHPYIKMERKKVDSFKRNIANFSIVFDPQASIDIIFDRINNHLVQIPILVDERHITSIDSHLLDHFTTWREMRLKEFDQINNLKAIYPLITNPEFLSRMDEWLNNSKQVIQEIRNLRKTIRDLVDEEKFDLEVLRNILKEETKNKGKIEFSRPETLQLWALYFQEHHGDNRAIKTLEDLLRNRLSKVIDDLKEKPDPELHVEQVSKGRGPTQSIFRIRIDDNQS